MKIYKLALVALLSFSCSLFAEETLLDLLGTARINAEGSPVQAAAATNRLTGVYFSAHWCPPCRAFTPELVDTDNLAKKKGLDFEIIFVSFDKSEDDMLTYMKEAEMPWLALPYESDATERVKAFKSETLGSGSIPQLVILSPTGKILAENGRERIESHGLRAIVRWFAAANIDPFPSKKEAIAFAREGEKREAALREKKETLPEMPKELPPPEKDDMTFRELLASRYNFEGKVVETEVTRITGLEQQRNGQYRAFCHHHVGSSCSAETAYFPAEAKEFCDELVNKPYSAASTDVYLYVRPGGRLEAVGERYRKNKHEYSW